NGIDGLPHADRAVVLGELRRVARTDGWVMYSTHNLAGPSFGEVPWRAPARAARRAERLVLSLVAVVRHRRDHVRRWRGWWAGRSAAEAGEGWAVRVSAAHHFGVLMHYSSAATVLEEARRAGLVDPVLFDSEQGAPVDPLGDLSSVRWFQVLARAS
ncbi:MAG: methyltransferase domain protein, partial [Acidimicrobiales bacterium]|nr:methyltransferase domain protein [Acidimicrobiales bacterium]